MAEEHDPKISQHYRELGSEEPPRELDQAILSAADRGSDRPHAPLVTPVGRHRWYYAFGAAAILVLAVAVTVQIERQQPDAESAPAAPAPQPRKDEPALKAPPAPPVEQPAEQALPQRRKEAAPPVSQDRPKPQAMPSKRAPEAAAPSAAPEPAAAPRSEARTMQAPVAGAGMADQAQAETPERWLERIVQLRKEGRTEEAAKQLAEFRKRYPDYKIPEAALNGDK